MEYTWITGACGGLGGAFCEILAERGEPLFLTGRSEERLCALQASLKERYPASHVATFPCDLRDESSRAALFAYMEREGIGLSRLVFCAGVDTQMAFEKFGESRIVTQLRVNFEGAVSCAAFFLSHAILDGRAELLFIGSMTAITPMPYFALYSAGKRGLEQFSIALREEMKGRAKVTCVLPGSMPTREDVAENIRAHGFVSRLSAKSPRTVAEASLKAVKRNKRRKIVGGVNHLIAFFSAFVPASLRMKIVAGKWKGTEKDFYGSDQR